MQWEYSEVAAPLGQEGPLLVQAGADGWELVTMLVVPVAQSRLAPQAAPGFLLVFKRPAGVLTESFLGNPGAKP